MASWHDGKRSPSWRLVWFWHPRDWSLALRRPFSATGWTPILRHTQLGPLRFVWFMDVSQLKRVDQPPSGPNPGAAK